ncbi:Type IV secretion system protein VirB11 [Candidatus Nitrotoga arctica]|uniref:Type IV secretion system protein VirB11 n=2 Tax=Candidatus Nitrotoga arctica TaxID=453162 RepID=A0ABM8YW56_9PROT|nr:Type IV secretion system protein VirB11 [Candidatus Nitrotoga arctica]
MSSGPRDQSLSASLALERRVRMLRTAMGPDIAKALNDPDVVEVMLNPDGSLWVDRLGSGREPLGISLTPADGERIIRLVAAHVHAEVHAGKPLLSAELPETGERFEGALPPVTPGPVFALRKRAVGLIRLDTYVADGILTEAQAEFLRTAVRERQNILIAGGTSTGKTTLANALLDEIAATGDRVIVLEDTVELQCTARDHVPLRTRAGIVTMAELVRSTLRLRPDRIVVGEVRGAEALDLLKAWGTGHPGGIATVHAGSAAGALLRLEQLILEVAVTAPRGPDRRGRERHRLYRRSRPCAPRAGNRPCYRLRQPRLPAQHRTDAFRPFTFINSRRTVMTPLHTSVNPLPHNARLQVGMQIITMAALLLCVALPAHAAGSNMPWEAPLQSVLESIQGPVARIIAVIVIITTGLTLAFGDSSGGFRKLVQIVFGLSIAFAASSFFLTFFSFAGGAVIA